MKLKLRVPSRALARALTIALAGVLGTAASGASAIDLMQAYRAAMINDPTYRMGVHEYEAGLENKIIGRAALLPSISANASYNENRTDLVSADFLGRPTLTHPEYLSKSRSINLRQPIINLDATARYRQGKAQAKFAEAVFEARRQDLAMRVVSAYVEALFSDDQVQLAKAQRDMYLEQRKVNDRLLKQGEGTRTEALETQAKLDISEAALLEALDNQTNTRNALQAIVGMELGVLKPLATNFDQAKLDIGSFESWRDMALASNTEIIAQTYQIESVRQDTMRAKAGHYPRLDLVASYGKSLSETLQTRGQESQSRSVGFQLSVPIYQGGQVNALTRQAYSNQQKAEAELVVRTDKALIELRKQFNMMISARSRLQALLKATESGKLLVEATRQSIKGGIRINLDLLDAQQQQYATMRDLAQARYSYLLTYLRLRLAAGTLNADDIEQASRYFR